MTDRSIKTKCIIITGGDCDVIGSIPGNAYVIACDKGLQYAENASIIPDLIVGDFDSVDASTDLSAYENVVRFPKEKDDTDTMLAIKKAISAGYRTIEIYGAFGGRMDHFIANIQSASYAAEHGALCSLISEDEIAFVFKNNTMIFEKKDGFSLSVFSLSDTCTGVTIKGTKYTTENAVLTCNFPLGVSNEFADEKASVTVGNGIILVMESKIR